MRHQDDELQSILEPARMSTETNVDHMQAVRQRMLHQARASLAHPHRAAVHWTVALLAVVAVSAGGLAATQTGRDLIGWVFTPVRGAPVNDGKPSDSKEELNASGTEQVEEIQDWQAEIDAIRKAGGGHLRGLTELPNILDFTMEYIILYWIDYELSDGSLRTIQDDPSERQAKNMRLAEILELRNAGAGQLVTHNPEPIGMGRYIIRFELSDGSTVNVETKYPPGTLAERKAIFAEAQELHNRREFVVLGRPYYSAECDSVIGKLRFTLADGRTVCLGGVVPPDRLTPDRQYAMSPSSGFTKEEIARQDRLAEWDRIAQAGGGRLLNLFERPWLYGAGYPLGHYIVGYYIEYVLGSGETQKVAAGALTEGQAANMRIDELWALRDAGAGQIVEELPSRLPLGLGRFLIRFELSDGSTVDVETYYPPGTRAEREAIFAEGMELLKKGQFTIFKLEGEPESPTGSQLMVFTLADGREVGFSGRVPLEMLTPHGKLTAPDSAEDRGQ